MPELPEVEAVRRSLEQLVVGKTIERVDVRLPRIVRTPSPEVFVQSLTGRRVEAVNRRGKYLLLTVSPFLLISHLRMEGQYRLTETDVDELPHTHVVFQFTDGTELRYRDVRQFGTMDLVRSPSEWPDGLARLGPEPFDPLLTPQLLKSRLASRTVPIKAAWLDQTVLAGVGNIYADEALFAAGIHPEKPAGKLTTVELSRLLHETREVLQKALDAGGSSIRSYVNGYGRHGGFQISLAVYGRDGEPCVRCGTTLEKTRVAGRGTHWCPSCQRKPRTRRARAKTSREGEKDGRNSR